jgi:hypothetical protein
MFGYVPAGGKIPARIFSQSPARDVLLLLRTYRAAKCEIDALDFSAKVSGHL